MTLQRSAAKPVDVDVDDLAGANVALQDDLRLRIRDGGFGCASVGAGLIKGRAEVSCVDARKHLAGLDGLVVGDGRLGDVARDLGSDRRIIRLHVGVVRGDQEASVRPISVTVVGSSADGAWQGGDNQAALQHRFRLGFDHGRRRDGGGEFLLAGHLNHEGLSISRVD